MNNDTANMIPDLKSKLTHHFKEAQYLFSTKHHINDFNDGDPSNLLLISEDYRSGVTIIDSLVTDDAFLDKDSFDVVSDALNRYYVELGNDYPMTALRVAALLSEMNQYEATCYSY